MYALNYKGETMSGLTSYEQSAIAKINWANQRQTTMATLLLALGIGIFQIISNIKFGLFLFAIYFLAVLAFIIGVRQIINYQQTIARYQYALYKCNNDIWEGFSPDRKFHLLHKIFLRWENNNFEIIYVNLFAVYIFIFLIFLLILLFNKNFDKDAFINILRNKLDP